MKNLDWMPHCYECGRYVNPSKPGTAWEACGEFGEETRWVCPVCVAKPGFRLQASNGLSDSRWCGVVTAESAAAVERLDRSTLMGPPSDFD